MRKLFVSLTAVCLILASCCGGNQPATDTAEKGCCKKEEQGKCCKGMTEEQKQACAEFKAKWDDWANLTDEVKEEMIGKRKECFDKKMAEMKEHEAKMQAHKAEMEEQYAAFETMTLDQQKDFFDNYGNICIKVKTKGCCEKKEGCAKKCEGKKEGCQKECAHKKEGCEKKCGEKKEGCGHHEGE